ncbi:MFS transporter, partial [Mesorhizobium sp. M2D.F.Ca.ET.223.01.1.1]
ATLAFGLLAYGLTAMNAEGGGMLSSPAIIAGVVLLFVFIFYEFRQRDPMIDLDLFRIRAFAGANLATFFLYFALSANLFYLPMLLIAGWRLSEVEVGFIFLPLSASIALLSGPVG